MKVHKILMKEASNKFKTADHMIYVTYPLLNDPKLIIIITDNLYFSLLRSIEAILQYEYHYKRLDNVPQKINETIRVFKDLIIKRYGFSESILKVFDDLHKITEVRKKSPVEFIRKDNFVICDRLYSTKMINLQKIKEYVQEIKPFIKKTQEILE